jgi:hypothetical protein
VSASSRYQVLEVQLADTRRHLTYKIQAQPGIHLNLKGFDYAWINAGIPAKPGLRVLDVGSGYSWLPSYLARERGSEVGSVDDPPRASTPAPAPPTPGNTRQHQTMGAHQGGATMRGSKLCERTIATRN